MDSSIDILALRSEDRLRAQADGITAGLVKYHNLKKKQVAIKPEGGTAVANDKPKVDRNEPSAWAKEEWEIGKKHGILQGEGERPKDTATREEVNAMIVRALKLK